MMNATTKSYYFLKAADGQYLQATLDVTTNQWSFWLATNRGCAPCCSSTATAEQYRAAAESKVGELSIVAEAL